MSKIEVIIVGSNPSRSAHTITAFSMNTKSGKRLHEWLLAAGVDGFVMLNVANYITPQNRALKSGEITEALPRLSTTIVGAMTLGPNRKLVAVGATAAKALTMLNLEFYQLPHPSGHNHQINDPNYVQEKINGLTEYLSAHSKSSLSTD